MLSAFAATKLQQFFELAKLSPSFFIIAPKFVYSLACNFWRSVENYLQILWWFAFLFVTLHAESERVCLRSVIDVRHHGFRLIADLQPQKAKTIMMMPNVFAVTTSFNTDNLAIPNYLLIHTYIHTYM